MMLRMQDILEGRHPPRCKQGDPELGMLTAGVGGVISVMEVATALSMPLQPLYKQPCFHMAGWMQLLFP